MLQLHSEDAVFNNKATISSKTAGMFYQRQTWSNNYGHILQTHIMI